MIYHPCAGQEGGVPVGVKKLNLAADLCGCPNRCLHCWLGHMPNRDMGPEADRFIVDYFAPYFDELAFYSWLREPDFCEDYRARWARDLALSKNAAPERFELAGFWRIARDEDYVPFLRSLGVKKVQLSFFGLRDTQDRYVGRRGAFDEVLAATDRLIDGGLIPRWQCFINEENREELVQVLAMAEAMRRSRCPALEFFVHEGSCDGENRKLYPIRIRRGRVPPALLPFYLNYGALRTEAECRESLLADRAHPEFPLGEELTLYVSNEFEVFYNFTEMSRPWVIGNLKREPPEHLVPRILAGDTPALRAAGETTWAALAEEFGDPASDRLFHPEDYRQFLFNEYLARRAGA